ncbi:hypothetical protein FRX31_028389 [Thalictrum thalictroides]|uniref:Transposase MuDR plant domain-containing protein n=1 Tax=Thalictrum thalictroides TaxID=46969 RepID=A0A7J6VCT0_THATH|nr:hypothetical protein FRX31_028389 [Thalictrum thalictroides]
MLQANEGCEMIDIYIEHDSKDVVEEGSVPHKDDGLSESEQSDVNNLGHLESDEDDDELVGVRVNHMEDVNSKMLNKLEYEKFLSACNMRDNEEVRDEEVRDASKKLGMKSPRDVESEKEVHKELIRKMPRFPTYNPNSDPFKYEPQVGMKFANPKELKFSLICYAVANRKNIRFSRSAHYKLEVKCVKGCPWRIWASWMQREKSFQIKSYRKTHKCVRVFKIKLANARFWGKAFCKELMIDPKMKPLAIRQQILKRHYVDITPHHAYKLG